MIRATLQFFRDIGHDIAAAVRWFSSPHAWRIALVVLLNLGMLVALGYVAISRFAYTHQSFAYCPDNRNQVFIGEFFAFTFFALFAVAMVGELLNWVDAKRKGIPPGSLSTLLVYSVLSCGCGLAALILLLRCE